MRARFAEMQCCRWHDGNRQQPWSEVPDVQRTSEQSQQDRGDTDAEREEGVLPRAVRVPDEVASVGTGGSRETVRVQTSALSVAENRAWLRVHESPAGGRRASPSQARRPGAVLVRRKGSMEAAKARGLRETSDGVILLANGIRARLPRSDQNG